MIFVNRSKKSFIQNDLFYVQMTLIFFNPVIYGNCYFKVIFTLQIVLACRIAPIQYIIECWHLLSSHVVPVYPKRHQQAMRRS